MRVRSTTPMIAVLLALLLAVITTLVLSDRYFQGELLRVHGRAQTLVRDIERIRYFDEVLTSTARLGALTGARRAGAATLLYAGEILSRPGVRGLAGRAVTRIAARRAGAVVAASNEVAKAYAGRGAAVSVVHPVIPPPPPAAELARLGGELRAALGVAADERVVACLGALTEGRGQRVLIEALARSRGRGHAPGWSVVIGGAAYERAPDRAYERRLREMVDELGLGGSVRFAGRVADPHALYAAADVFANPALVPEGFGRAACEALSCGCPVVSSTGGGVGEALADGETALLVEPGSAEALAAAIERLLGDRELAGRLAGAGAEDVARRLSPEAGQAEFERALEAALAVRAASEPTSP